MIDSAWLSTTGTAVLMIVLTALGIYVAMLALTRLAGLRSFSKMSSFDFAITVAMGSLIATVILSESPPLLNGVVGLAALFGIQYAVSWLRKRTDTVQQLVDNDPLLLMAGQDILHEHLKEARMTMGDLEAKLREANVIHPSQVRAVVMESTGDVAVLHADTDGPDLDLGLLSSVRGLEHLRGKPNVQRANDQRLGER